MINIAIVEDNKNDEKILEKFLMDYQDKKCDSIFNIKSYNNPLLFLDNNYNETDIIFLDIQMPFMDGISLANKIRKNNNSVFIVFITNMLQYAIDGYKVNAFDFILKPIKIIDFERTMDKLIETYKNENTIKISIKNPNGEGILVFSLNDIIYIESNQHKVIYHTSSGNYSAYDTLNNIQNNFQDNFQGKIFSRCHVSFFINLKYVSKVEKDKIFIKDDILPISRNLKSQFYSDFAKYLGGER